MCRRTIDQFLYDILLQNFYRVSSIDTSLHCILRFTSTDRCQESSKRQLSGQGRDYAYLCLCYNTGSYSYEVMRKWKALPQWQRYANESEDAKIEMSFLVGKTEDVFGWQRSSERMQNGEDKSAASLSGTHTCSEESEQRQQILALFQLLQLKLILLLLNLSSESDSDLDLSSCSDGPRINLFYNNVLHW